MADNRKYYYLKLNHDFSYVHLPAFGNTLFIVFMIYPLLIPSR